MNILGFIKDIRVRGTLAGLGLVLIIVLYTTHEHAKVAETSAPMPASALLAAPQAVAGATSTNQNNSAPETVSTTIATSSVATTKAKVLPSPTPVPAANPAQIASQELTASGGKLLHSLVNIVCVSSNPSIPSISGSGVIIDSRGIILTVAHVAQLFTLQDYLGPDAVSCLIRTGSPARRAYLAEPIYISPSWLKNNPHTLTTTAPQGTGENDFALLGITGTATSTPLPSSFPALPLAHTDPIGGQNFAIGSYGAQYLTSSELNYSLYPILVFGTVQDRYTFHANTVDLVSILGSAASQEGSSGGALVSNSGEVNGIITTSSVAGTLATRTLNAITVSHIRRSFTADTGDNLDSILAGNSLSALITSFAPTSKVLGAFLAKSL